MISKYLPKEKHPPYMNYMGPGTEVEKRLSLNYKGKRGTKNYMIPTTYSDYVSFEHDLLYWSPDNVIKAYADAKFIKDIRSIVGYTGILAQYVKRLGIETLFDYITFKMLLKSSVKFYKAINDEIKDVKITREIINEMKESLNEQMARRRGNIPIDTYLRLLPEGQRRGYLESLNEIDRLNLKTRYKFRNNILFHIIPKLAISAYLTIPRLYSSSKNLINTLWDTFINNTEYNDIQERVNKVKNKFDEYLKTVGNWNDAPWFRSLITTAQQPEGEKFFKVKENINKEEAKKKYIEFYNEFEKYATYMNNKYKDTKGYIPFEIEKLNLENINLIEEPSIIASSFLEEYIAQKRAKLPARAMVAEDIKPKDINDMQAIDKLTDELKEEINKVLSGEQSKIGVTSAQLEIPDDYINFEELYGTIPEPIKAEREPKFTTPPDKEILKVLEGEQSEIGVSPAQLEIPDDFNFEDYF